MWQSGLPVVCRIAGAPASSIPAKACGAAAARTRVDRDLDVAVGAVLEADRHREAGAELAVGLALGRAGADRPPGDGVGDVLRRDRVEELAADRQAEVDHLEQQLAGHPQAGVDVAGAVQVRVVDQALPAGRRPRLLEVDPHHDQQPVAPGARRGASSSRTRAPPSGRGRCRARPRPAAASPCRGARRDFLAALDHHLRPLRGQRQLLQQLLRRRQLDHFRDPLVPHPVSFRPLHPDDHFAVAFLQTDEIVLSGRSLPGARARDCGLGRRPAEDLSPQATNCRRPDA